MILRPPLHPVRPPKPTGRPQILRLPRKYIPPTAPAPSPAPAKPPQPRRDVAPLRHDHVLRIVFPVCAKDAHLLVANLEWCFELDGASPHHATLAYDTSLAAPMRDRIAALIAKAFPKHTLYQHPLPPIRSWPQAPNWVFQHVAQRMKEGAGPWLWMEPDAWALKPGWLDVLEAEYFRAGKAVMGPVVKGMGHCNGVAIYPASFCDLSPRAMRATNGAWDSESLPDVNGKLANAAHLMQHAWGNDPNGTGFTQCAGLGSPTFPTPEILKWLLPTAVLFHRCKDLTLVKQLRQRMAKLSHTEILIVSYAHDIPYLKYNFASIRKFATGFRGVTLVVPEQEADEFKALAEDAPATLRTYARTPDAVKWHLHAQAEKCYADLYCPEADFILHTDSDCVFTEPVTPSDYFNDGKPVMCIEQFANINSNWKPVVERILKRSVPYETMRRHPQVNPRKVYPALRQHIASLHKMDFRDFVLSCKPTFPWGFTEHNVIGSFALAQFQRDYHWIDVGTQPYPHSKLRQFWSYSPPEKEQSSPHDNKSFVPADFVANLLK